MSPRQLRSGRKFRTSYPAIEVKSSPAAWRNNQKTIIPKMFDSIAFEKETEELSLPLASIRLPALEIRGAIDLKKINELAQSMKSVGQLHRIGVMPMKNADGCVLIYGERRLRAAMQLGWKKIEAKVFFKIKNPMHALAIAAAENTHNQSLRTIENITIISELKNSGFDDKAIAKILGQSDEWVKNHLFVMRDSVARRIAETGALLNEKYLNNFMLLPTVIRNMLLESA